MKVVIDTNVWVSAFFKPDSFPGKIVSSWKDNAFQVFTSDVILDEIHDVLNRPKIQKLTNISEQQIEIYTQIIRFFCSEVEPVKVNAKILKLDKNDALVLGTFIAADADYLITGGNGLLACADKHSIVTPKKFMDFFWW